MINNLIFPNLTQKIKHSVFTINEQLEIIDRQIKKVDYNYMLICPSIIFKFIKSLNEKEVENILYKDLFLYTHVEKSLLSLRFENDELFYISNIDRDSIHLKNTIISNLIIKNKESECLSIKINNKSLSTNKSLFFKKNRIKYQEYYEKIQKFIEQSKDYYDTFLELFYHNNIEKWIKSNSQDIFCFSLYFMSNEMKVEAISTYKKTNNHFSYTDFENSISKMINLIEDGYRGNILNFINLMENEVVNTLIKSTILNFNLINQLDNKEKKQKTFKI